ncbi:hypothetical protein AB4028_14125 [Janibacter sp. RAF20_2_2]|uniref:hypothetical protein n=1 Tax=unclassified Janibacter TaxID=2649294 RepID=UPI003F931D3C
MKNPVQSLFSACLMLLGCVIALGLVLELLAQIWPWLVGVAAIVLIAWIAIQWTITKNRRW